MRRVWTLFAISFLFIASTCKESQVSPGSLRLSLFSFDSDSAALGGARESKGEPTSGKTAGKAESDLIPRHLLEGNEDFRALKLSHDGKWLSYLSPYNGVLNIWVRSLEQAPTSSPHDEILDANPQRYDRPLTKEQGRGIQGFTWSFNNQHILYFLDRNGDENWRLFRLDVRTGISEALIDNEGVQAQILAVSAKYPNLWIIGLNNRDPRYHDPYRFNILTGERTRIFENNRFKGLRFDHELRLRLVEEDQLYGGSVYYVPENATGNLTWKHYKTVKREDADGTRPLRFDSSNEMMFWQDATETDKSTLIITNFSTPTLKKVLHNPAKSDIELVLFHPRDNKPVLLHENYLKRETIILDKSLENDINFLKSFAPSGVTITIESATLTFNKWIVMIDSDVTPPKYYLYDRGENRSIQFLFSQRKELLKYKLAATHPVEIETRDRKLQVCYLTLPTEVDALGTGKPHRPGPLLLSVHGGPWARDSWGFNAEHQLYANRGYATLACNYRGSTGYGKDFLNAGNGEWGGKMHNDLLDAVEWSIRQGIADPTRIAIYGASYGGYASLIGLTLSPLVFACGIDVVGPSNLITLIKSVPPYWRPIYETMTYRIGGDPETPKGREFLKSRSPLTYVDQIQRPLLIGQGANDPRVKQAESDQVVRALKAHNIPVSYVMFPDEGHGWLRPANRRAFAAVMETFLADCLGGKAEPVGAEDFVDSSIKILENGGLRKLPYKTTSSASRINRTSALIFKLILSYFFYRSSIKAIVHFAALV